MPRGASEIPILRLEVLQDFITRFKAAPNLMFTNLFPGTRNAESDTIKWESQRGGRGMVPFVPPGAPAPVSAPHGIAQHQATAAYWKEKRYFDEEFLNNLRKPGTESAYQSAADTLADNLADVVNRANRRKEWMFSNMFLNNGFSYQIKGGYTVSLDYGIPADHRVALTSSYYWDTGGSVDILGDIKAGKRKIAEANGGVVDIAICNSQVLDMIGKNSAIRSLLQTNAFHDGSLMAGPGIDALALVNAKVIGTLLDIKNFIIYDEMYEVKAEITGLVTGGSTTWIQVNDASDFDAAQTLTVWDRSAADTYEKRDIISVDKFTNRIQIDYPFTNSYIPGEDYVTMQRYYVPGDKFIMMSSSVEGTPISRYIQAPFGLGRHWGLYTDKKDEWDPEGTWIRVQDKGLPVLYHTDAIYTLDVTATAGESATTTTTTTSSTSTTTST
ncbi:MAG: major capsid protein [Planctomycetota bacterium]